MTTVGDDDDNNKDNEKRGDLQFEAGTTTMTTPSEAATATATTTATRLSQFTHQTTATKQQDKEDAEYRLRDLMRILTIDDFLVSIELRWIWRVHLVYAKKSGQELVQLFTSRLSTMTVFMTLLIGAQVGALFSPSKPTERARTALLEANVTTVDFYAGFVLIAGICVSLSALMAIMTAWVLNSAISQSNAHIILRSSLWLYASTLPVRLALVGVYMFVVTLSLFFFVICRWYIALPVVVIWWGAIIYLIALYNASARVLMQTGAIGDERIVERDIEYECTGREVTQTLIEKALIAERANIPIREQYRIRYQDQLDAFDEGHSLDLSGFRLPTEEYLGSEYGTDSNGSNNNSSRRRGRIRTHDDDDDDKIDQVNSEDIETGIEKAGILTSTTRATSNPENSKDE